MSRTTRAAIWHRSLPGSTARVVRQAGWALRFGPSRRALARRAAAIAIAIAVGWQTESAVTEADRLRDQWDPTTAVVVADRSLRAGQPVKPTSLRVESRPRSLVPADAITELPTEVLDAVVDIPEGEVLLSQRLGGADDPARIPDGHVAIAVEPSGSLPPTSPGDHVDLLAASLPSTPVDTTSSGEGDLTDPGGPEPTTAAPGAAVAPEALVVAPDAIVIATPESTDDTVPEGASARSITLAVAERDAAAAAAAILAGPVTIAIRPG